MKFELFFETAGYITYRNNVALPKMAIKYHVMIRYLIFCTTSEEVVQTYETNQHFFSS